MEEIKLGLNGSDFLVFKDETKLIEGYIEPSYRCIYNSKVCVIKQEINDSTGDYYLLQLYSNNQEDFVLKI